MSKSILIVDTPKSCGDCRFCDYVESIKFSICTADPARMFKMRDEGAIYSILVDERCSLKPLPKKKTVDVDVISDLGWNDCLAEITGDKE